MPGYMYRERKRPYLNVPVVPAWVDEMIEKQHTKKPKVDPNNLPEGYRLDRFGRPQKVAKCGTLGGYNRHENAGEKPCQECRDARNAHRRANPGKKRVRSPESKARDLARRRAQREERRRVDAERLARL